MFLTDNEKELGYELLWKNRDSKILVKKTKVIGTVTSRESIFMAIESHERYCEIVRMNSEDTKPISSIDKAHIAAFAVVVIFIAVISVMSSS